MIKDLPFIYLDMVTELQSDFYIFLMNYYITE